GEAARFAGAAGFCEATRFGGLACFDDLPCFDEPLKRSENQPAWLTSIGSSATAAMATMMVRRRNRHPQAILPRTQMNSRRLMLALPKAIIAAEAAIPEEGPVTSVAGRRLRHRHDLLAQDVRNTLRCRARREEAQIFPVGSHQVNERRVVHGVVAANFIRHFRIIDHVGIRGGPD